MLSFSQPTAADGPDIETVTITPSVLYVGTPVVLVVTQNADGSANITPMSSAWALGTRIVLGLAGAGQGVANLLRDGECTLNFASADLWYKVEEIAHTTGRDPVPAQKAAMGFVHAADARRLQPFGLGTRLTAAHSGMPLAVRGEACGTPWSAARPGRGTGDADCRA